MDRTSSALAVVARSDRTTLAPIANRHCTHPPAGDDHVARLMQAIAAGDQSALWRFREVADPPVRRQLLATLHRLDVPFDTDDLDGMVTDAVLAIAEVAGAWRPGGAPPWVWAHRRVVCVVHRFVGIFARSLDALADDDCGAALARLTRRCRVSESSTAPLVSTNGHDQAATSLDPADVICNARAALRRLACDRPDAALLDNVLSEIVSERDAALWLAVLDEREAGNRHPAVTIGTRFGMRPDAVRKAVQRVGGRLRQATENDRFAPLESLPVLSRAVGCAAA